MPRVDHGERGGAADRPSPLRVPRAEGLTGGRRGGARTAAALLVALLAAAALPGCTQAPQPEPVAPPEAFLPPPTEEPAPAGAAARAEPGEDPTLVLVDPPAEPEEEPPSLVEAALAERERRLEAGKPRIVITDRNLQDHARGELTFAEEASPSTGSPTGGEEDGVEDGGGEGPEASSPERGESYWRQRVRDLRLGWRDAHESIGGLEARAADLRNRFYAEDDGYYRDSQIKPQWDRALASIEAARREVERFKTELQRAIEEGRREGALPGWLRDGVDLEPRPAPEKRPIHEPGEPEITDAEALDP